MTMTWQGCIQLCNCGNPVQAGRPTCGIVICLADDTYERAIIVLEASNTGRPKPNHLSQLI